VGRRIGKGNKLGLSNKLGLVAEPAQDAEVAVPQIPWGPASSLGVGATLVQYVLAIIAFATGEDRSEETITFIITGTVTLVTVIAGRMAQSKAAINGDAQVKAGFKYLAAASTETIGGDDEEEGDDESPTTKDIAPPTDVPQDQGTGGLS
jgi:hypothetical protein